LINAAKTSEADKSGIFRLHTIVQRNKVYSNEFATQVKRFLCGAPKSRLTSFSKAQQRALRWFLESISHRENGPWQPAFGVHGKLDFPRSFSG
jgi:hypothetical protein